MPHVAIALTILVAVTAVAEGRPAPVAEGSATAAAQQAEASDSRVLALERRFGRAAYVAAPVLMVVVAIVPFPAEVPAMLNGMVFGPVVGTAITYLGALIGAWISFLLARRFGRPLAQRFVRPRLLARVDRLVESAGWPGMLVLRLVPTVAFTGINWGAGLTHMPRWRFVWTTAVGILPGAVVFTTSGSGVVVLWRTYPWVGWGLGTALAVIAGWTIVRYRRRAVAPSRG